MVFKKKEEDIVEETKETKETKNNVKIWTEEELAILPREEFLEIEKQIKEGKAKVQSKD